MTSGIYAILNTIDGKVYIGQTVDFANRFNYHRWSLRKGKHSSPKLQNAWNKHGEAVFEFKVLIECSPDTNALTILEQQCFDAIKPEYNIAPAAGSNAGHTYPPEFGKKISAALRWKKKPPRTEDHKRKLGDAHRGVPALPQVIESLKEALTGVPKTRQHRANMVSAQKKRRLDDGTAQLITFDNQTHTLPEWAKLLGMEYKLLDQRLWRGWTPERAFTTPIDTRRLSKKPRVYQ